MRPTVLCTALLSVLLLSGCGRRQEPAVQAPPPPPPPSAWVQRDSAAVADELVGEMLRRPWVGEFKERTGRVPKVVLGEFSDRAKGEVDLALHRGELARALAAGGIVQVLDTPAGADFVLRGAVGAHDGAVGDLPVKRYQIDLTLVDATTGDVVTPTLSIEKQKDDRVAPPAAHQP